MAINRIIYTQSMGNIDDQGAGSGTPAGIDPSRLDPQNSSNHRFHCSLGLHHLDLQK